MSQKTRACGFPHITPSGAMSFSSDWHREHMQFHLAAFPEAAEDQRTVDNLNQSIVDAEERERLDAQTGEQQ